MAANFAEFGTPLDDGARAGLDFSESGKLLDLSSGGTALEDSPEGLRKPGNLDAFNRKELKNPDGSISTASTISIGTDEGEVLIPTVVDGKRLSNDEAIKHYRDTGEHFGVFDTPEQADKYAEALHNKQADSLGLGGPPKGLAPDFMQDGETEDQMIARERESDALGVAIPPPSTYREREAWTPTLRGLWPTLRASLANLVANMQAESAADAERFPGRFHDEQGLTPEEVAAKRKDLTENYLAIGRETQDDMDRLAQEPVTMAQRAVNSVAQSAAPTAISTAVGMLTRNPELAAGTMYPTQKAQSFGQYANYYADTNVGRSIEQRAADLDRADAHATLQGVLEAGTEVLPFEKYFKVGSRPMDRLLEALAAELPGESLATITETLDDTIAQSPEGATVAEVIEGLQRGFSQLPDTWAATILQTGIQSSAFSLAERAGRRRPESPAPAAAPDTSTPLSQESGAAATAPAGFTPDEVIARSKARQAELEGQGNLKPVEQQELDFLRQYGHVPEAISALYGMRLNQPVGERDRAKASTPPLSDQDKASPLPTELIETGRQVIQDAVGHQSATDILSAVGFPKIDSKITITDPDGTRRKGVVVDAYDEGGVQGAKIRLDDGTVLAEPFDSLRGRVNQPEKSRANAEREPSPVRVRDDGGGGAEAGAGRAAGEPQRVPEVEPVVAVPAGARAPFAPEPSHEPGVPAANEAANAQRALGDEPVTIYRGEGRGAGGEGNAKGGDWWTTNREKAAKYGDVREIQVTRRELETQFAQGHGGKDEYVFGGTGSALDRVRGQATPQNVRGEKLGDGYTAFSPESGTLGIPRADMPQIKAEHRGALAQFLKARGIDGIDETGPASALKPTQAEFSEQKVLKAKNFQGGDRAILVSGDGYVLDGHHQWLAALDKGEDVRVIRLNAPIKKLLTEVAQFPSVETAGGAEPKPAAAPVAEQPRGETVPIRTITVSLRNGTISESTSHEPVESNPPVKTPVSTPTLEQVRDDTKAKLAKQESTTGVVDDRLRSKLANVEQQIAAEKPSLKTVTTPVSKRTADQEAAAIIGDEGGIEQVQPGEKGGERFRTDKAIGRYLKEKRPMDTERERIVGYRTGAKLALQKAEAKGAPAEVIHAIREELAWAERQSSPVREIDRVAQHLYERFAKGETFGSITDARRAAGEFLGRDIKPGTADAKMVDEAVEWGATLRATEIIGDAEQDGDKPQDVYRKLVDLYTRQMPTLGTRTSTSVSEQAYSTPLPLAYVAQIAAGIKQGTSVYEPTAGNGALLTTVWDGGKGVVANELNAERAANLKTLYPNAQVKQKDAAAWRPLTKFDVVIGNPPFGVVRADNGDTVKYQVNDEYSTGEIDHAITLKALSAMKDDGAAVFIVGSVAKTAQSEESRSTAYNTKAKREFYFTLYRDYNVVDHFTVAGELYEKQGAGWPVDVIVVRGKGKSALPLPAVQPPRVFSSWDALAGVLNDTYRSPEAGVRAATGESDRGQPEPRGSDERARLGGRESGLGGQRDGAPEGQPGAVREGPLVRQPGGARPAELQPREPTAPVADHGPSRSAGPASLTPTAAQDAAETRENTKAVVAEEGKTLRQVAYKPASKAAPMGTLVPVNMQTAHQGALQNLQAQVGDVETYVADKLGYAPDDLKKYFGAEQVDALALAINNIEKGAGFIIGDQTGIGKGRVVAGIIRYTLKSGQIPIFVTEKPNLYGDMYRDLTDIGIQAQLGREPKILMTNAGSPVPLDEEGKVVLKNPSAAAHNAALNEFAGTHDLGGQYDMVFTTYSQMQTQGGAVTPRMRFLEAIAPGNVVIFDESHNAGGTKAAGPMGEAMEKAKEKKGQIGRSTFARNLVRAAKATFYSSATYAKRPDVMDLYSSTDMRLAVSDINKLGEAITKGGVPMQQVVASMLAEAGQYTRRERSFDGIKYNTVVAPVDRQTYADYSRALSLIQDFSEKFTRPAKKAMDKRLKAEAKSISADGSTGGAGIQSTNFTAIMHNLIDQMLLSISAEPAAARAIEAIKAGEKPVITVANTMGSFIQEYVEGTRIAPGDKIGITFNTLLQRYLDRTRVFSVKKPFTKGPGERMYLEDEDLGPAGVDAFEAAKEAIGAMDFGQLPASPIDYIRHRIQEAGYKVGEITARTHTIDYKADGAYYRTRSGKETSPSARRKTISSFNGGTTDAMIINQAGSTGLSLHASEKFKDQKKRRMILAQPEKNIDTHMQMLGRVNRTGQVVIPEYDQLVADVPAVKRPAAVLSKKMASLNANTTGARGHALKAENVPDFMNQYGDEIAARLMQDNPEIHHRLGEPLKSDEDGYDKIDAARKVTGRIPLLPIDEQERIYDLLETEYADLIAQKEAAGESALEAKTLDLDAKVKDRKQVIAPQAIKSPFADGVYVETANVKRLGRPHTSAEVIGQVAHALGIDAKSLSTDNMEPAISAGRTRASQVYNETMQKVRAYRIATVDEIADDKTREAASVRMDGLEQRFRDLLRVAVIGQSVRLQTNAGNYYGVVTAVEQRGAPKNPIALGSWKITLAMADSSRKLTLSMSQLEATQQLGDVSATRAAIMPEKMILGDVSVMKAFDVLQTAAREDRTIITGNLLAGFEHVGGRGSIVNFTDAAGGVRQGILMPRDYNYEKAREDLPVPLHSAEQVIDFTKTGEPAVSSDRAVEIKRQGAGLRIEVAASKQMGGQYFLNRAVIDAMRQDFVSVGNRMRSDIPLDRARATIEALKRAGASFQALGNLKKAAAIAGSGGSEALSLGDMGFYSALGRAAEGLKQAKGSPEQMLAMLRKTPGVKEDEIAWTGLDDYVKAIGPVVTKQQIVDFVNQNGVQVEETTLGGEASAAKRKASDLLVQLDARGYAVGTDMDEGLSWITERRSGREFVWDSPSLSWRDQNDNPMPETDQELAKAYARALGEADAEAEHTDARYETYTLPGGSGYRELLLTLPEKRLTDADRARITELTKQNEAIGVELSKIQRKLPDLKASRNYAELNPAVERYNAINKQWEVNSREIEDIRGVQNRFTSGHFDQKNVLAHVRLKDRTAADGSKVLFVEEVQSDWAQLGRRKGFVTPVPPASEFQVEHSRYGTTVIGPDGQRYSTPSNVGHYDQALNRETTDAEKIEHVRRGLGQERKGKAPIGPFVGKTEAWASLALKRVMRMAVDGGYDAVAWTTGEQQAERYDLSKHIDRIFYEPAGEGLWEIEAWGKNQNKVLDEDEVSLERIEELFGKEIAKKIENDEGTPTGSEYRSWRSLSGLDLKVGGEGMKAFYDEVVPKIVNRVLDKVGGGKVGTVPVENLTHGQKSQPGFKITDAMREKVGEGLPLFQMGEGGDNIRRFRTKAQLEQDKRHAEVMANIRALGDEFAASARARAAREANRASVSRLPLDPRTIRQRAARFERMFAELKDRLAAVGISDAVVLKLRKTIIDSSGTPQPKARGRYAAGVIEIALANPEKQHTLNHEIIHLLRDYGVIRPAEWEVLSRKVLADQARMDNIRDRYKTRNLSEDKIIEEAVADLHGDYATGRYAPTGFIQKALERIRNFLEALGNALRGAGFQSANDVMAAIQSGEIGARIGRSSPTSEAFSLEDIERARNDFWKLPHVEHDHWTMGTIADMVDQAQAQLDLVREGIDSAEVKPGDAKKLERFIAKWKAPTSEAFQLEPDDTRAGLGTFNPKLAADIQKLMGRGPVEFSNPETEKRWQEARKGIGADKTMLKSALESIDRIAAGFSRHHLELPNEARFANAQEQVRKLEAAGHAAQADAVRNVQAVLAGLNKADLDLFTRKIVLDDLAHEVEREHELPFGLTAATLSQELEKVDAALANRADLRERIAKRGDINRGIADEMIRWGVLAREQAKNPNYYRHQVLDYARAQVSYARSTGKKLKTPRWARRHGSTLDISANYLEAEFEWMQKALNDIATAKTIAWFKKSEYNVRDQTTANAKAHNDRLVSRLLEEERIKIGEDGPLQSEYRGFSQRIGHGLSLVRKAIESGSLADIPPEHQNTADKLVDGTGEGNLFPFLGWILDNDKPGSMGAAMAFKAINQRKAWVRAHLGERYADPMQLDDLVKRGFAPEGYKTWQPDDGKLLFTAKTIPEHVVDRLVDKIAREGAGTMTVDELRGALESVRNLLAVGGPKYQMILPEEIAATLSNLKDTHAEGLIDHLVADPLKRWKQWTLINPRRVLKYNLNNLSGDLDAVIAGNPKLLKDAPRALGELRQVMLKGKTPSARYREAVERAVFDSGLTVQEIPDVAKLSEFEHLTDKGIGQKLLTPFAKTWQALQRYTQFRENILRYAAYLNYVERLEAGESMRSIGYGASNPAMVDAVSDVKDKAALLARDLLGDYGAISHYGRGLRNKVIPFYSWMEINTKRYWRLGMNAWGQGVGHGFRTSGIIGASLGIRTTAYLGLRMIALYTLMQLWNNLLWGDDEDKLSELDRTRMHLILGHDPDGKVLSIRLQGALSDFLEWLGFNDAVGMLSEIDRGRASYVDLLKSMAKAPVNKIVGGLTPVIQAPVELLTGQEFWPDAFNPRVIHDDWRYLAQLFSVEHEYDALRNRPSRGYLSSLSEAVVYRRDPGEAAYNRIKGMAYDWKAKTSGETGGGYSTPRSEALRDWRVAIKVGDKAAERAARDKMRELGVKAENRQASIRQAAPLGGMSVKDKAAFKKTLTAAERHTLEEANRWYRETYLHHGSSP